MYLLLPNLLRLYSKGQVFPLLDRNLQSQVMTTMFYNVLLWQSACSFVMDHFAFTNFRNIKMFFNSQNIKKKSVVGSHSTFLKKKIIYLFIFGRAGSSLLCGIFSSCSKQGLLSRDARASHCSGFSCCGAWGMTFTNCGT